MNTIDTDILQMTAGIIDAKNKPELRHSMKSHLIHTWNYDEEEIDAALNRFFNAPPDPKRVCIVVEVTEDQAALLVDHAQQYAGAKIGSFDHDEALLYGIEQVDEEPDEYTDGLAILEACLSFGAIRRIEK